MASVFVSHRSTDKETATRLAADIRSGGHGVWLDAWEIRVGRSVVGGIDEGLGQINYLFLLCPAEGDGSAWVNQEWMSALARRLNGEEIVVVPVLLPHSKTPPILADLRHVDLGQYEEGLAVILDELSLHDQARAPP